MNFPGSSSPSAPPLPPPSYDDANVSSSPTAPPPYSPGFICPDLTLPPMRSAPENTVTVESQPISKSKRRCNYKLLLAIFTTVIVVVVVICVIIFGNWKSDTFGIDDFPTMTPFKPFPPATTTPLPNGDFPPYDPYGK